MFSSSSTFFAPSFLSSSPPPFYLASPPYGVSQISSSLSAKNFPYTCADGPPKLFQIPQRFSASASFYEILEIPICSTSQEIKYAFRRLARICHPDVVRNGSSREDFTNIHTAYCTLSDPEKRDVYDRKILRRSWPLIAGVSGLGSYGVRNWKTDQCW